MKAVKKRQLKTIPIWGPFRRTQTDQGSQTSMKRSCAHRWNARRRSWTGPISAHTSGPRPHWNRAAKKRKRRKSKIDSGRGVSPPRQSRDGSATLGSFLFATFAPSRGYLQVPAALREDFINQGYDASQSRINETAESSQIVPNPGKSSQIDAKNIVLHIRLKIERLASPAGTKPFLSEARLATRPRLQKRICALASTVKVILLCRRRRRG